jgi:hypothetical protein
MALPKFKTAVFTRAPGVGRGDGRKANNDVASYSGIASLIYGTNASNSVDYGMGAVFPTDLIRESKLTEIANKALAERTRRGGSQVFLPGGYFSGQIIASRVQDIITNVSIAGPDATQAYNGTGQNVNSSNGLEANPEIITYPKAVAPSIGTSFSRGQKTSAADINVLIGAINAAGNVCTCNCNYCTCNCNYCTCNCNYSCTCNCNYSDETVKANVEYM